MLGDDTPADILSGRLITTRAAGPADPTAHDPTAHGPAASAPSDQDAGNTADTPSPTWGQVPAANVDTAAKLRRALGRGGVLVDHPSWHADPTDAERVWLAALACGIPVVSIDHDPQLPGAVSTTRDQADDAVHRLLVDDDHRERVGIAGRRHVVTARSRRAALEHVLAALGRHVPRRPSVSVLLSTHRPERLGHALASVTRQSLTRQGDVEVVLVLHGDGFDHLSDHDVREQLPDAGATGAPAMTIVRAPARWTLGECLNAGLERAGGHLVAKMDDDDHYGRHHLADLVAAWTYSGADVVGKRIEFVHLAGPDQTIRRQPTATERDRPHVGGPTLLAERSLLAHYGFLRLPNRVDSTLYERVRADGGRVYGTHARDLVLARHGQQHAWDVGDETFREESVDTRDGLAWQLASSDVDPVTLATSGHQDDHDTPAS